MKRSTLGIDVSKKELVETLLYNNKKKRGVFENQEAGYKRLDEWVKSILKDEQVIACAEATGCYSLGIANYLYQQEYEVSIVNPFCIKSYAQSKLSRHKNDEVDSNIIAEYARVKEVMLYKPVDSDKRDLKCLYRCLQDLKCMQMQANNHLENKDHLPKTVIEIWVNVVKQLEQKIAKIEKSLAEIIEHNHYMQEQCNNLQTVPGIGKTTAVAILAEMHDIGNFRNARQLAAYVGITPKHRTSGTSIRGKTRISKIGSHNLRKALYFPAIVAKNHNPIIKLFCNRLEERGKHKKAIVCAAIRKLVHIIFGILKNNTTFKEV